MGVRCSNPDGVGEQELGRIRVLTMRQGDRLRMTSPSGGGFGAAFSRDPGLVLSDVTDGLLSAAGARCYGVAITDGAVDAAATAGLRRALPAVGGAVAHGPGTRKRYEGIWPAWVSVALAEAVLRQPAGIRTALLAQAREALRQASPPVATTSVDAMVAERARRLLG